MVRRTSSQHPGGISNGPRIMDLANLGEVSVLKVPIRPGRTEALVTWFKEAADKEGLWDLLSEQGIVLTHVADLAAPRDHVPPSAGGAR